MRAFSGMAQRVGREFFPEHVDIITTMDDPLILENSADHVEVRVRDQSGPETVYGVAGVHGSLLRSPHLEDIVRHELRGLAERMGYATPRHSEEP